MSVLRFFEHLGLPLCYTITVLWKSANTVNGLQDAAISLVNLPSSLCNVAAGAVGDFRFYEISSPDWSSGWSMEEDPLMHAAGKFIGGESAFFLVTTGASQAAVAGKCARSGLRAADKAGDAAKAADKADDAARLAVKKRPGSRGLPDHQKKVSELMGKARKELKPGEYVRQEGTIKKIPSTNRRPDVQIIDKNGRTRKVLEAERYPNRRYNQLREQEYRRLGIEYETYGLD